MDFDDKLKNINKKVSLNKAKHITVEEKLNALSKEIFSQHLVHYSYQNAQELIIFLKGYIFGNQNVYIVLFFLCNILLFLHSIHVFGYRIRIKFDKDRLVVEQDSYATKIINFYIVYELRYIAKNSP